MQIAHRFDADVEARANQMGPARAQAYKNAVEEQSTIIFEQYKRDPNAARRRLGLPPSRKHAQIARSSQQQSMGDLVVRTAVRATVWNSVASLFRLFR